MSVPIMPDPSDINQDFDFEAFLADEPCHPQHTDEEWDECWTEAWWDGEWSR